MSERRPQRPGARGGLYVWVLGVCVLVTLMVLSGLEFTQIATRKADLTRQMAMARQLARSALEWGIEASQASTVRTTWSANPTPLNAVTFGGGTMSLSVSDPVDGAIASGIDDPVVLKATGVSGSAKQMLQAQLTTRPVPLDCLKTALCVGSGLTVSGKTVTSDGIVASNTSVFASNAVVNAVVEAGSTVSGALYLRPIRAGVASKSMPTSAAITLWAARGTPISYSAVGKTLEKVLLSPSSNPYGATNPLGIYVIDCAGNDFKVRNARVVGTLIVLNPKNELNLEEAVSFEAINGQPSLMVLGNIKLNTSKTVVDENAINVNLNPASTPYKGVSNTTQLDLYPDQVGGLVYVTGVLTTGNTLTVNGVVIVGQSATISDDLTFNYDASIAASPPEGFRASTTFVLAPGSVQQIVDP